MMGRGVIMFVLLALVWATIYLAAFALKGSRSVPAAQESGARQAYVFLMTNDRHLRGLLAMNEGLRQVGATRPRYAAVTPAASLYLRETLKMAGIGIIEIPAPKQYPGFKPFEGRWRSAISKLEIWALEDLFDRIVYVDVDATVNSNPDWLFDETADLVTMQDDYACNVLGPTVAGGLISLRPDIRVRDSFLRILSEYNITKGDQEVIDIYFKEVLKSTPKTYNESVSGFIWRCDCIQRNIIPEYNYQQMMIVQFTGAHIGYSNMAKYGIEGRWYTDNDCAIVHFKRWLETWFLAVKQMNVWLAQTQISDDFAAYLNESFFVN